MKAVVKHCGKDAGMLYNAIQKKMEINAARKWKKLPDGRYKHEEENFLDLPDSCACGSRCVDFIYRGSDGFCFKCLCVLDC